MLIGYLIPDELGSIISEDKKRLYTRKNVSDKNKYLFDTAKLAGVKNYGKINNYGYRGLNNGETAKDIANRKDISEKEVKVQNKLRRREIKS